MKGKNAGLKVRIPNNTRSKSLLEAILTAAGEVGEDLRGRNGVLGYLKRMAIRHPPAFAALLRALPPETTPAAPVDRDANTITKSVTAQELAESAEAYEQLKLDVDTMERGANRITKDMSPVEAMKAYQRFIRESR